MKNLMSLRECAAVNYNQCQQAKLITKSGQRVDYWESPLDWILEIHYRWVAYIRTLGFDDFDARKLASDQTGF